MYKANKDIKYLDLTYSKSNKQNYIFKIHDNKVTFNIEENTTKESDIKITLSNKDFIHRSDSYKEIINEKKIQKNLSKSLTPNENSWQKISMIANRTFVPESEESRNKGAGGGDAND